MRPYEQRLFNEGFPRSRVEDLNEAMDTLHDALSKLDNENLERFWGVGLGERLFDYAKSEDLRNVVPQRVLAREVKI